MDRVTVPEGQHGDWKIERFTIEPSAIESIRLEWQGRSAGTGEFTRLMRGGQVWMSDTDAEVRDLYEARRALKLYGGDGEGRVLIHGLGIGLVVQEALNTEGVRHVDVVDIEPSVIALVAEHYQKMAAELGKEINIIQADCLTYKWPTGMFWQVVWHDIWQDICTDNLKQMKLLHRKFGRRCKWQGSWSRSHLEYLESSGRWR